MWKFFKFKDNNSYIVLKDSVKLQMQAIAMGFRGSNLQSSSKKRATTVRADARYASVLRVVVCSFT